MGYVAAVTAFVIWGIATTLLVRFIPLPAPIITTVAYATATLALLAQIGPRRWGEVRSVIATHGLRVTGLAVASVGCSMTYQWAMKITTVANAIITHSNQALFTCLIFLPFTGKGWPSKRAYAALALGLAGLAIAFWDEFAPGARPAGIILGTVSAIFYAWYNAQLPFFKDAVPRDVLACGICIVGTVAMLACLVGLWGAGSFDGAVWGPLDAASATALVSLGVLNYAIAGPLYLYAAQHAPISHVAILAYLEPVVGVLAGAAFLAEPLTAPAIIGGALVLASSGLVVSEGPL